MYLTESNTSQKRFFKFIAESDYTNLSYLSSKRKLEVASNLVSMMKWKGIKYKENSLPFFRLMYGPVAEFHRDHAQNGYDYNDSHYTADDDACEKNPRKFKEWMINGC